ncbi:MAG: hypothetical protein FJW36_01210 [Acidobacteria bacterium]|nr:hypothetical protein [Acidobacteriota bacterium]
MRVKYILLGLTSLSCLLAQSEITLDESSIQASLRSNATVISFPFSNPTDSPAKARLTLEWIESNDHSLAKKQFDIEIAPRQSRVELPFPIVEPSIWTRLRYRLSPVGTSFRIVRPITGIAALPKIASHVFEVHAHLAGAGKTGKAVTILAQAIHPISRQRFNAVSWKGELTIRDAEPIAGKIQLLKDGFAAVTFDLPAGLDSSEEQDLEFEIQASEGDFSQSASLSVSRRFQLSASFVTDKRIYQPGQVLHARALVTTSLKKPAANEKLLMRLHNSSRELLYSSPVTASRFGIVHEDWPIYPSATPGTYEITLCRESSPDQTIATHSI